MEKKTISEKAKEYSLGRPKDESNAIENAYIAGACEQYRIDMEELLKDTPEMRSRILEEIVDLRTRRLKKVMKDYLDSREEYLKHLKQQWMDKASEVLKDVDGGKCVERFRQVMKNE